MYKYFDFLTYKIFEVLFVKNVLTFFFCSCTVNFLLLVSCCHYWYSCLSDDAYIYVHMVNTLNICPVYMK